MRRAKPDRMAWMERDGAPAVSVARLTRSSSPASTPSATDSDAPSSASIVFSATIGSRSGRASVPNTACIGEWVNRSAFGTADSSERKQPSTNTMRGASIRGRRASSGRCRRRPVLTGSWNAASATGRRLVYFHASSRRPDVPPAGPPGGMRLLRPARSRDRRAGARAAPRSGRGSWRRRFEQVAVTLPPRPCRRSPWLPARAPVPGRPSGRSGRRPAHARGPARCGRAAADNA